MLTYNNSSHYRLNPPQSVSRIFSCSVSDAWDEKQPRNPHHLPNYIHATSFSPASFTPELFRQYIADGYKFTPCTFEPSTRREATFLHADLFVLDYDGGNHSIDTLLSHPVIAQSFLIYGTPSWREDAKRWRVVFCTAEPIDDIHRWRFAAAGLFLRCGDIGGLDRASMTPSQPYAGSRRALQVGHFAPNNTLSTATVDLLEMLGTPPPPPPAGPTRHSDRWDEFVRLVDSEMMRRGALRYTGDGWSNAIRCPFRKHQHDAHSPAAYWNKVTHSLTCHKCQTSWNCKDAGAAVGVTFE